LRRLEVPLRKGKRNQSNRQLKLLRKQKPNKRKREKELKKMPLRKLYRKKRLQKLKKILICSYRLVLKRRFKPVFQDHSYLDQLNLKDLT